MILVPGRKRFEVGDMVRTVRNPLMRMAPDKSRWRRWEIGDIEKYRGVDSCLLLHVLSSP